MGFTSPLPEWSPNNPESPWEEDEEFIEVEEEEE